MVSFLEFLEAATVVALVATLYLALRKRRRAAERWGLAAGFGIAACATLELYLRLG